MNNFFLLNIGGKYKRHVNVIIFYKPDLFEVRKDHIILQYKTMILQNLYPE